MTYSRSKREILHGRYLKPNFARLHKQNRAAIVRMGYEQAKRASGQPKDQDPRRSPDPQGEASPLTRAVLREDRRL